MSAGTHICTQCGSRGDPRRVVPGSLVVELVLWGLALVCVLVTWFALVVPVIYSVWRAVARRKHTCRACSAETLVPIDSPVGRRLAADPSQSRKPQ